MVLWDRLTGEVGGDPEIDSGGVVGSISKDSEDERRSRSRSRKSVEPSAAGPSSRTLSIWTGDLASVPDSTVLASGG